jgi:hypothetical protein
LCGPIRLDGTGLAARTKSAKEEWVMKFFLKLFFIVGLFSIFVGLMTDSHAQTQGELIVNFAYAPEKIRQGDIWKIYLSVTDPDGNMHRVSCRIQQQGGRDFYNRSVIYLKKGMEKQFTGYFALSTQTPKDLDDFVLELSILDRGGNERKTFRFPLEFDGGEPVKPLPPDMEKDLNRRIGNFYIDWSLAD